MTKTQAAGEAGAESEPKGRLAQWRSHTFRPASELPYRRRSSDWVRLVLGALVVAFAIANEGSPGEFEQNLYSLLNGLPSDLRSFFTALYDFAALWALGIIVSAANGTLGRGVPEETSTAVEATSEPADPSRAQESPSGSAAPRPRAPNHPRRPRPRRLNLSRRARPRSA